MNENTAWLRKVVCWAVNVVLVLVSAWFPVYGFYTRVPMLDGSMQPVLDADDVVLVSRLVYDMGKPEQFDIVIFEREDHRKNVKRIIGLPGETVQIKGGYIFTDNELLNAEDGLEQTSLAGEADIPTKLEDNEYFLLGDNRDSSEGSQFPNAGNVKRKQTQGKVWLRIFPLLKLGFIHSR